MKGVDGTELFLRAIVKVGIYAKLLCNTDCTEKSKYLKSKKRKKETRLKG